MPDFPVAAIKTVSDVEVSPSTEIELKVRSFISDKYDCKTFFLIKASVKMYTNIVAISGAIIPEPLAIPAIKISPSSL